MNNVSDKVFEIYIPQELSPVDNYTDKGQISKVREEIFSAIKKEMPRGVVDAALKRDDQDIIFNYQEGQVFLKRPTPQYHTSDARVGLILGNGNDKFLDCLGTISDDELGKLVQGRKFPVKSTYSRFSDRALEVNGRLRKQSPEKYPFPSGG